MSGFGLFLVLMAALLSTASNLMMRAGIDAAGGFTPATLQEAFWALLKLFVHPVFIIGFVAFILANVTWFRTIASEPLSAAYPALVGLTFVFLTSGAAAFLNEPITFRKIMGLGVILAGILLISLEKGTTTL